jgi:hypothetical protein
MTDDRFKQLAQVICNRCFGGRPPAAPVLILEAVLKTVPVFRDENLPEEAVQYFADGLFNTLCEQIGQVGARLQAERICEEKPSAWLN